MNDYESITKLLMFVQHKSNCDYLQGPFPCGCGLMTLLATLPSSLVDVLYETNEHVRATIHNAAVRKFQAPA